MRVNERVTTNLAALHMYHVIVLNIRRLSKRQTQFEKKNNAGVYHKEKRIKKNNKEREKRRSNN